MQYQTPLNLLFFNGYKLSCKFICHLSQFGIEDGNYKFVQEVIKTQPIFSSAIWIYFETLNVVNVS